ncbi:MAG: hypothetical protein GX874_02435 [Smithella sp.]|nr:hypothetical protein [Smithella sp.]
MEIATDHLRLSEERLKQESPAPSGEGVTRKPLSCKRTQGAGIKVGSLRWRRIVPTWVPERAMVAGIRKRKKS